MENDLLDVSRLKLGSYEVFFNDGLFGTKVYLLLPMRSDLSLRDVRYFISFVKNDYESDIQSYINNVSKIGKRYSSSTVLVHAERVLTPDLTAKFSVEHPLAVLGHRYLELKKEGRFLDSNSHLAYVCDRKLSIEELESLVKFLEKDVKIPDFVYKM